MYIVQPSEQTEQSEHWHDIADIVERSMLYNKRLTLFSPLGYMWQRLDSYR